mmetsp:Transcript_120529/g.239926  ORF Transcript_120529/g.239926 Transcript_120529/m.239926 type:complete len:473 (+) Transcript_120529:75-1493(+)
MRFACVCMSPGMEGARKFAAHQGVPTSLPRKWRQTTAGHVGRGAMEHAKDAASAFDLHPEQLAPYARRLVRQQRDSGHQVPGSSLELSAAWETVAFQAQGFVDRLTASDACSLLCAFGSASVLFEQREARSSLMAALYGLKTGTLRPQKVLNLWIALDRADVALHDDAAAFFQRELSIAAPLLVATAALPSDTYVEETQLAILRAGKNSGDWKRLHALLEASSCSAAELAPAYAALEAATLADGSAVRALSVNGLVAALRATVLALERTGEQPSDELVRRLCDRAAAQARWLDGWGASHAVLAAALHQALPGRVYDALRPTLLERCRLQPKLGSMTQSPPQSRSVIGRPRLAARAVREGSSATESYALEASTPDDELGFAEAGRVLQAVSLFDVHDAELRRDLSGWLLRPLPPSAFMRFAEHLASIGLNDRVDARLARIVRARARSKELVDAIGGEAAQALLLAYMQMGDNA